MVGVRMLRGNQGMTLGHGLPDPPRRHRPQAQRDHDVEVFYPGGLETAVLAAQDGHSVVLRFDRRTPFTTYVEHNARFDYRISLRASGRADGDYHFADSSRNDNGTSVVTLHRAIHRQARNVDIAAGCRFGEFDATCAFTMLSATGGTLRLGTMPLTVDRALITFSLKGKQFELPSLIEHAQQETLTVAFRPLTAAPLEDLAKVLGVSAPPTGHLSIEFIAKTLSRERMIREAEVAAQRVADEEARAKASSDEIEVHQHVMWDRMKAQRVVTTQSRRSR